MAKQYYNILRFALIALILSSCAPNNNKLEDINSYAESRKDDFRLSTYITAHTVEKLLSKVEGRREAISIFKCNGITKAYIEVYRSGLTVNKKLLKEVIELFERNGINVVGGIATVPGKDFGVRQEGKLGWFNWQNKKTQNDLKNVMQMSAELFDEFIIDDFLCTADTSEESRNAKGARSWSEYRRDLLTKLSSELFINPAKEINPQIKMIIKYPQWYDRFHLFGYDLSRQPQLFDEVWVGTESRGQYTQRYGFVQPYEGFVNFRWIKDIAKDKIGGAWFDHGDCDADDFIEQAYQSVLAGAEEIVIFNYNNMVNGHKGHHLLRNQFNRLADIAELVSSNPAEGISAYKPINSDAGGDLYLMDFIGALGVPLIPVHKYPHEAKVILLPTQAASDTEIMSKIKKSISRKSVLIVTSGFLANLNDSRELTQLAGLEYPVISEPLSINDILLDGKKAHIDKGIELESRIRTKNAEIIINTLSSNGRIPLLVKSTVEGTDLYTLNTHTFSQKDFDLVGEVLLCPKPLGLLDIPQEFANKLRDAFTAPLNIKLDASTRIGIQLLGDHDIVLHNYNKNEKTVSISSEVESNQEFINMFNNESIKPENNQLTLKLDARSRIWLKRKM